MKCRCSAVRLLMSNPLHLSFPTCREGAASAPASQSGKGPNELMCAALGAQSNPTSSLTFSTHIHEVLVVCRHFGGEGAAAIKRTHSAFPLREESPCKGNSSTGRPQAESAEGKPPPVLPGVTRAGRGTGQHLGVPPGLHW